VITLSMQVGAMLEELKLYTSLQVVQSWIPKGMLGRMSMCGGARTI
jgi:hypothetical protein